VTASERFATVLAAVAVT
jgi:cytochrome c biogenesis protein CcmG/thiol:disulfide interchange protein DsbE